PFQPGLCTDEDSKAMMPKLFEISYYVRGDRGEVIRLTEKVSIDHSKLYDFSLLVLKENKNQVRFGPGLYEGLVGVYFENPSTPAGIRIRMDAMNSSLIFKEAFSSNVISQDVTSGDPN